MTQPLSLVASGVSTHAGDVAFASFGAISMKITGGVPDPAVAVPGPDGEEKPALKVPLPASALSAEMAPAERMAKLLSEALTSLLTELPTERLNPHTLIYLLLPPAGSPRSKSINGATLKTELIAAQSALAKCQWEWSDAEVGAVNTLEKLLAKPWKLLIFAGVDSLLDNLTLFRFAEAGRLMSVGGRQGIIPGEAAAALALTRPGDPLPARALLRGWGSAPEPALGKAEEQPLRGLGTAIEQALNSAAVQADQITDVYHSLGTELSGDLEWYQVQQRHWQGRKAEQAPQQQRSCLVFGDVGAAGLPLHVAVATAGLEFAANLASFGFSKPGPVLACETPDTPVRGAVCLTLP